MRVKSLNENHLVISQSFSGVCVIVLALLSSALFQIVLRAEKMTIGLHLVSFAPFVFLFGIGLTMLRSLKLKEDGIYHKWLGICYKKTEWKRVQDIARAYQGRNGPAILVTMQGTHVFTQAEYQHAFGHIPDGFPYSINYLCGKYLVFPNHEAILKYLQRKVGDLSYDVIQTKGFHAH